MWVTTCVCGCGLQGLEAHFVSTYDQIYRIALGHHQPQAEGRAPQEAAAGTAAAPVAAAATGAGGQGSVGARSGSRRGWVGQR
jgi:hypothetical protein